MNDGCFVADVEYDIEKGERPQTINISIGADQYFWVDYTMTNCTLNTGTNPPTIEIGYSTAVKTPYDFVIGIYHDGYPTPNVSPITLSSYTYFSYNGSVPVYLSYGQSTYLAFRFIIGGHRSADLTFNITLMEVHILILIILTHTVTRNLTSNPS